MRPCDGAWSVEQPRKRELRTHAVMGRKERWSAGCGGWGASKQGSKPRERAAVQGEGERACGGAGVRVRP